MLPKGVYAAKLHVRRCATIAQTLGDKKAFLLPPLCLLWCHCLVLSAHIITKNNAPVVGGKLDLAPAVVFSMGMVVGAVAICGYSANQHFL